MIDTPGRIHNGGQMCFPSIKQSIQDGERLVSELEDVRAEKARKEQICREVEAGFKLLVRIEDSIRSL